MAARGDITASEIFQDRELLNRLGYGIFDVAWGKTWIGSENVRDFTYVVGSDLDPKTYRRKVYEMLGRYYDNQLAKKLWYKFLEHKLKLSEQAGREVELKIAAQDWFNSGGHAFLKDWALHQEPIPERIRNLNEPRRSWISVGAELLLPGLKELFEAGFSLSAILKATFRAAQPGPARKRSHVAEAFLLKQLSPAQLPKSGEVKPKMNDQLYMRVVALLTDHPIQIQAEAQQWSEILKHQAYLSSGAGPKVDLHRAILDYYRRLALLEAIERGYEQ